MANRVPWRPATPASYPFTVARIVAQAMKEGFKITECRELFCHGPRIHSKVSAESRCFRCDTVVVADRVPRPMRRRQCKRCKKFYLTAALWNYCEKCREYRAEHPEAAPDGPKVLRRIG